MSGKSWVLSLLYVCGLVLLYIGERIAEAGNTRLVFSAAGMTVLVAICLWRLARSRAAGPERARVEKALLGLHAVGLAALTMYFAQSDALAKLDGGTLEQNWPKVAGALAALWPGVLAVSLLPTLLIEFSYSAIEKAPRLELIRVREAMYSGLGLAAALVFALSSQYVVSERDVKADLSYFRTTKPGDATRRLVQSLDEPIKASLFFPSANDVGDAVKDYFDALKAESPKLEVETLDYALEPTKARALSATGNGVVIISKGERKETIFVGQELEKARTQLKSLDQDVNKRLLLVAKSKRTIYLTQGHGERTEEAVGAMGTQRSTIAMLRGELKAQNYDLKTLSAAEGLGSAVPQDAMAVLILGPTSEFSAPEAKAIEEYEKRGGKLIVAIDPEMPFAHTNLLEPLGLKFTAVTLANDVAHARKTYTPADRAIISTNSYSSHPIVGQNGRQGTPMFFMGAGAVEELPVHPAEISIDMAVRAMPQTWNDVNNNFSADSPPEVRKNYGLVAAVTRRAPSNKIEDELRAVVMGDSDVLADEVLQVARGNALLVLDSLKWVLGDEKLMGATNNESDAPIVRTRSQDSIWFYATIFLAPALVIAVGFLARRRAFKNPLSRTAVAGAPKGVAS